MFYSFDWWFDSLDYHSMSIFRTRILGENSMWMDDTIIRTMHICHPEVIRLFIVSFSFSFFCFKSNEIYTIKSSVVISCVNHSNSPGQQLVYLRRNRIVFWNDDCNSNFQLENNRWVHLLSMILCFNVLLKSVRFYFSQHRLFMSKEIEFKHVSMLKLSIFTRRNAKQQISFILFSKHKIQPNHWPMSYRKPTQVKYVYARFNLIIYQSIIYDLCLEAMMYLDGKRHLD